MCTVIRSGLRVLLLVLTTALASIPHALAQSWPQRTVKLIIPLPPGTGTDIAGRLLAERLAQRWGQPVVMENKQGGDGIPAVTAFLSARDTHTLLLSFAGIITINPLIHDRLPYDPAADLVPLVQVSDNFIGVAAAATLKVNTVAELIHVARRQSGKLNWAATPGLPYYVVLALEKSAGIEMVQVGYREFGPALQDLATGRLHVAATGVPPLLPHHQAGTAKLLFVTNRERSPQVPEVPTAREAGYSDLSHSLASAVSPTRTPTRLPSCCERAIPPQLGARACRPTGRLRSTSIPSLVSGWTAARRRSITVKGRGRPLRRSYARLSQFGAAVPALQASAHSSRPFLSGSDRTSSGPNSSQPSFVLDEFIPHLKVEKIRRHGVALRLGGKSEGRRLLRRVRDIRAMPGARTANWYCPNSAASVLI